MCSAGRPRYSCRSPGPPDTAGQEKGPSDACPSVAQLGQVPMSLVAGHTGGRMSHRSGTTDGPRPGRTSSSHGLLGRGERRIPCPRRDPARSRRSRRATDRSAQPLCPDQRFSARAAQGRARQADHGDPSRRTPYAPRPRLDSQRSARARIPHCVVTERGPCSRFGRVPARARPRRVGGRDASGTGTACV